MLQKRIIRVRMQDNKVVLFQLADGTILNDVDLRIEVSYQRDEYYILTNSGFELVTVNEKGNLNIPPFEKLTEISRL